MRTIKAIIFGTLCFGALSVNAQLSTNEDKFLGNITTGWASDMDVSGVEKYYQLWNQVTPENATKWSSVEGTRGSFNWWGADKAYNYAKEHKFPFKFHTLVWGSQFPDWVKNQSVDERYKAIVNWIDKVKQHFPDLEMIDVVNEAVGNHQPDTHYIKDALGGGGTTGYDWIIKAFELAYERWPNAILIYNDFNTFQWDTDEYIKLVRTLRDAGAPIDAYGCQSHDMLNLQGNATLDLSTFKSTMDRIQNELKMPMYSTEYDVGTTDDDLQLKAFKEQIPYIWERDYCAGITLWGYIYGQTWVDLKEGDNVIEKGISGIIKSGKDRPAMTWLREYMTTDAAKNAKSPFPGMKKQISLYIKPESPYATINAPLPITVRAQMVDKNVLIDSVELYVKGSLFAILKEAPYTIDYTPATTGKHSLKAIVYTSDKKTYEREGSFTARNARSVFKNIELPGTLQFEDFDKGGEGFTFHDSDSNDEGSHGYRSDNGGIDIKARNGGQVLGNTVPDEWMEYTVNVKTAGTYKYRLTASCGVSNSSFSISLNNNGSLKEVCKINVPQTGDNSWSTYSASEGQIGHWDTGTHILRITITGGGYANLDKIEFSLVPNSVNYISLDDMNTNGYRYNLGGQRVNQNYRGISIRNGKKVYIIE